MDKQNVSKVIVVFKTHLDIGFTGMARDVLRQYCDFFIPAAVDLAFQVNTPERKKFVWTVGSYLIKYYFEHADEAGCEKLAEAIRLGYVCWHGLACTTHTELMDRRLLEYDLSIAQSLDRKFEKNTIAAKMTDVPGHTIGLVPVLAEAGIQYLHLGVNASSRVPDVPAMFVWKCGEAEVIVNYAGDYGDVSVLENGTVLEFFHAHDNAAPPTPEELDALFAALAEKYPNAHIEAGTLDEFAAKACECKAALPVITEEIGDTWIHGVSTDPWKVSCFRRLLKLKETWISEGKLLIDSPAYDCLMEYLLLIAEHTWGMDVKKYLLDFTNWDKEAFRQARKADDTDESFYDDCNRALLEGMKAELHHYHGEKIQSSYTRFETSHQEQRDYIWQAMELLPEELKEEAKAELRFEGPEMTADSEEISMKKKAAAMNSAELQDYSIVIGGNGEVTEITEKSSGYTRKVSIGTVEYEIFGGREVDNCYYDYGRNLKENYHWSEPDFGKPGLHYHKEIQHTCFKPVPVSVQTSGNTLYILLRFPQEACESYGCPREFAAVYELEEGGIRLNLYWKDKDAIRSPEAIWVNINLNVEEPSLWKMNKSGTCVSPLHVCKDGNRKLHCVQGLVYDSGERERTMTYANSNMQKETENASVRYHIYPLDAPLVSPGGKTLYSTDNEFENLSNGWYFLLYNNRWGTNFKQWYEEDMRFEFRIQW